MINFKNEQGSKPFFYPKEKGNAAEDEGYLMTFLYNYKTESSSYCIWDAQTMDEILRVPIKKRVPIGFHGIFVDEKDLEQ